MKTAHTAVQYEILIVPMHLVNHGHTKTKKNETPSIIFTPQQVAGCILKSSRKNGGKNVYLFFHLSRKFQPAINSLFSIPTWWRVARVVSFSPFYRVPLG